MFNKYTDTTDDTFLSETLHLEGEITCNGKLRIAGLIDGNVNTDQLELLDTGSINGNIKGKIVEIDGQVNGNLDSEIIVLGRNAVVKGDIYFAQSLKTEEGADVDGYIKKSKRQQTRVKQDEAKSSGQFGKPTLVQDSEKEAI